MMVLCSVNGTIQLNINHTKRTIVGGGGGFGVQLYITYIYIILFTFMIDVRKEGLGFRLV